ncbi:choice-of-anchor U domain-containing protein, partial [Alishewanella longhuensis]|uniref:choice-of-anchor U domain-containing protein n=1 Tax=Alishewanella longhuensis TaxID=1091037 RepID=UPI0027E50AB5
MRQNSMLQLRTLTKATLWVFCGVLLSACGGGKDEPQLFTVTANAGSGGSISPGNSSVQNGQTTSFTLNVNEGYSIAGVTGCNGSLTGNTYTTGAITAACSVQASFNLNSYTVSATAGEGGSISPETAVVSHGVIAELTITAESGYTLSTITGCDGSLTDNTYRTAPITSACSVAATFAKQVIAGELPEVAGIMTASIINTDEVYFHADTQGFIPVSGHTASPTQAPPAGWSFPNGLFDFTAVQRVAGGSAVITFSYPVALPDSFSYYKFGPSTLDAAPGWYVLPTSHYEVSADRKTLTLTIFDGQLGDSDGEINGIIKDPGGPAFQQQYSVTATAGEGGSISPGSATVVHGATTSFTVTPNSGFAIASVTGCNGSLNGNTYTTGAITSACGVQASFSQNSYSVSASAGNGGSISPGSATVVHGATTSFTVTPNSGFAIASVTGCNGSLT